LAERLLAGLGERLGAQFLLGMAQDYVAVDPVRAGHLAARALAADPHDRERQALCHRIYTQAGDWRRLAALEQSTVPSLPDPHERGQRAAALANIYMLHLEDLDRGIVALQMACDACPDVLDYTHQLAAAYALRPSTYPHATALYAQLLRAAPRDAALLRTLARLYGQQGDVHHCHRMYVRLLSLVPDDAEATRFVRACRDHAENMTQA
jgi:tetratricopeptide (TPR) repeat protein